MAQITFVVAGGKRIAVKAESGSLMQAAVAASVPGIDADCGGSMVCGTCHVYVDPSWQAKLPTKSEMEMQLLEGVPNWHADARLSCQIAVSEAIDGLVAIVPPVQR